MGFTGTVRLDYLMNFNTVEEHWKENYTRICKRMSWRAGSPEGGEDVVQEAYYRAIKYLNSYKRDDDFGAWFNTILNNALREHKNAEKGYSPVEYEEEDEGYECPSYIKHVMRDVFELIDTKSDIQKEVLYLYFKQEYSAKNISEVTQYSYARCHQIIQRFREELKELYRE